MNPSIRGNTAATLRYFVKLISPLVPWVAFGCEPSRLQPAITAEIHCQQTVGMMEDAT